MKAYKLILMAACSLGLVVVAAPAAQAQFAHCKADAHRLCAGVPPGGGRLVKCLKAQEDQVTIGCAKELKALKAKMGK